MQLNKIDEKFKDILAAKMDFLRQLQVGEYLCVLTYILSLKYFDDHVYPY